MRSVMHMAWCGAVAGALALSAGCSGEGEQTLAEKYPIQSKTCDALFGSKNMESLREMVGPDDLEFTNRPLSVDKVKKGLTQEALEPYDKIRGFEEYDVCWLSGDSQFHSTVTWAADSLKAVQSSAGRWHRAGSDVFVADTSYVSVVFRCDVKGASQQAQVLLEARVGDVSSRKFSEAFHEELAVRLARTVRDELRCTNQPEIPDDLAIEE
ncbi:hypothetical protein I2W78_13405 [Streptomyces spinoverrucosus]|uniref:hypothetical protein n=1 Tax=Streptomyces spinoverrucosus TaxID=284043 RepID=UPI0018C37C49|nr:hypothetical protein [Streptomyces spinoverrucosus]MBG0852809.1 hypothetical protein [Streptomyces spinoverrucosus]